MSSITITRFKKIKGTREQVWSGVARETSGGLQKKDLMISKTGDLVSKKASIAAKDRMKSGEGFCEYCIKIYKEGKIKNSSISKKKSSKKKSSKKKSSKKKSSKKKSSKKIEPILKVKKIKGVTQEKVEELIKEIEKIREKAGRIAEREGKMTKEVTKLLELVTKKTKEMIMMKKVLKEKSK